MEAAALRVASVPSGHVYVRHLTDPCGLGRVVRLADPPVPGAPAGQWWPSPMLEAGWVRRHAGDFDLFHVHFGFDDRSAEQLQALAEALREARRPLVITVHDLRNPHHREPHRHAAALDVLIPEADGVITLTPGAAAEIVRRWDRHPVVIPHPHVVSLERTGRPRRPHDGFVFGLHAKSERANNDSVAVARGLAEAIGPLPDARLQIDVHDDAAGRAVAGELGDLDVRVHRRFSDHELWDYLADLDVSVLPYRFGSHSGWMEACRDLGTTLLVPSCGFYAEQGPAFLFRHDESGLDVASLATAVQAAYTGRPRWGCTASDRLAQRRRIAHAHEAVYRAAMTSAHRRR